MPTARPPLLEVTAAGLLTTIQDGGRFGHRDVGVPVAGACDPVGLAIANLVIGNRADDAAIECTLLGPELLALEDVVVGLGGADLGAMLGRTGRRLVPGRAHRLMAGDRITFGAGAEADACRAYLAVPGGIDVPVILGSRSTSLVGAFGGFEGRPLRAGDPISALGWPGGRSDPAARWPGPLTPRPMSAPVRVLAVAGIGAATPSADATEALAALERSSWRVAAASDRRGIRLDGPPIGNAGDAAAPSHGVVPGTIQLTPSGQPIVLLPDCGTTGGYPVIGVVITADLWRLGQAAPGAAIAFEVVDHEVARHAASDLRGWIAEADRRIRSASADSWDDLAGDASG
jgi:biotin-dependent carboxylase-like uncharacterized protein